MRKLLWKSIDLKSIRKPEKPGLLVISHPQEVSGGLFSGAERIYWIKNDTGEPILRGGHYHPQGKKIEYMICVQGTSEVELHSADCCTVEYLNTPTTALLIPNGVWHAVKLNPGAILLCVASTSFEEDECREELPCSCVRQFLFLSHSS